ncbi:hypothetical protein DL89DRAFT_264413 [Linderina pennispora]|uniref:BHLH domain-containing protein n=1 Tax=Linderina pennispora TaxID=61395 RepID=A0A1Y1WMZ6_9FUNG|nr:uncharacterized protein DL89DRAFT_264413 [Linderina pennispora]ORX74576.1 hypothetical protein DL89DRAFT_264413 [Linderina pennispora]
MSHTNESSPTAQSPAFFAPRPSGSPDQSAGAREMPPHRYQGPPPPPPADYYYHQHQQHARNMPPHMAYPPHMHYPYPPAAPMAVGPASQPAPGFDDRAGTQEPASQWGSAMADIRFRVPIMNAEERERKRRVVTNTIINDLKELIPWLRNEARLQKLEVLEQCVCYIKELQLATADAPVMHPGDAKRRRNESSRGSADTSSPPALSPSHCITGRFTCFESPSRLRFQLFLLLPPRSTPCHCLRPGPAPNDLPDLTADSATASKASSTASTITPFSGPLPKEIADSKLMQKMEFEEPHIKNSINFIMS